MEERPYLSVLNKVLVLQCIFHILIGYMLSLENRVERVNAAPFTQDALLSFFLDVVLIDQYGLIDHLLTDIEIKRLTKRQTNKQKQNQKKTKTKS